MDNKNIYTGGNLVPPSSDTSSGTGAGQYIPKHEKAPEPAPQQQQQSPPPPPPPQQQRRPVYDAFMYEPIGFDEYDRLSAAEIKAEQEQKEKKQRTARERAIVVLFFLLVFLTLLLATVGIIADVIRSKDHIKAIGTPSVVLYQNSKPEGANELANFIDENGRYTTEGAAASVKESIVEIYTYTDTNGVRTNVLQIREPGAMLSPSYYTVEDNYQAARMFADSGFLEKLDSSGYEYELVTENSSLGSALGICICKMNAQRFEDISGVADVLYDAAESCNYPPAADNEKYGAKNDIFSHHAAYLGITTKNDYVLGFLNVYVNTGPDSYLKAELEPKADVIAKAEDYYRLFSERGYIDGEFPTDESR